MRFLKKLLISVYIFTGIFAIATFIVFTVTGTEAITLTTCVFGVAGIESMLGAVIKSAEEKTKSKEDTENGSDNYES